MSDYEDDWDVIEAKGEKRQEQTDDSSAPIGCGTVTIVPGVNVWHRPLVLRDEKKD